MEFVFPLFFVMPIFVLNFACTVFLLFRGPCHLSGADGLQKSLIPDGQMSVTHTRPATHEVTSITQQKRRRLLNAGEGKSRRRRESRLPARLGPTDAGPVGCRARHSVQTVEVTDNQRPIERHIPFLRSVCKVVAPRADATYCLTSQCCCCRARGSRIRPK